MSPGSSSSTAAACVLLTGGGGFVGRMLRRRLSEVHPDWQLVAPPAGRGDGDPATIDVRDAASVEGWIDRTRPDMVVHLAAVSAVTASTADPRLAWGVNLDGTLNVVLSMQRLVPDSYLLHMSSGDIYGASAAEGALTETSVLQPLNAYSASKAAADLLVRQAAAQGLRATVMRPFNQIGPGQSDQFAIASFATQIARIEAGLQPPVVEVGNLANQRDFIDVRDAVDAYVLALERRGDIVDGRPFNICSGRSVTVGEMLDRMLTLSSKKIDVKVDSGRVRPTAPHALQACADRARVELDWVARRGTENALAELLAERREACRQGTAAWHFK